MNFEILSSNKGNEIPEELINLVAQNFENVKDKDGFESYFFKKHLVNPVLNWMKFDNKIIGFYSMFEYQFVCRGDVIKAGKPELNLISKEFLRYCLDKKINYNDLNPLGNLTSKVFEQAEDKQYAFLFTWPNNISLPTYIRNGYRIKEIKTEYFIKITDKSFFKKYFKNYFINFLFFLAGWIFKLNFPSLNTVRLEKTDNLEIEKFNIENAWVSSCKNGKFDLYCRKTNDIVNKKFGEDKFIKFWVKDKSEISGYIVLKRNNNRIYIADYIMPEKLLYPALSLIRADKEESIMFLKYYNDSKRLSRLKMLIGGYFFAKKDKKKLAYKILSEDDKNIFSGRIFFDHFVSDFSI